VLIVQSALRWIGREPYLSDAIIEPSSGPRHIPATSLRARATSPPVRDPAQSLVSNIKDFVAEAERQSTAGPDHDAWIEAKLTRPVCHDPRR
jgi:hypothetical protein